MRPSTSTPSCLPLPPGSAYGPTATSSSTSETRTATGATTWPAALRALPRRQRPPARGRDGRRREPAGVVGGFYLRRSAGEITATLRDFTADAKPELITAREGGSQYPGPPYTSQLQINVFESAPAPLLPELPLPVDVGAVLQLPVLLDALPGSGHRSDDGRAAARGRARRAFRCERHLAGSRRARRTRAPEREDRRAGGRRVRQRPAPRRGADLPLPPDRRERARPDHALRPRQLRLSPSSSAALPGTAPRKPSAPAAKKAKSALKRGVTLKGTKRRDHLIGTPYADHLSGRRGADVLEGRGGADYLTGAQAETASTAGRATTSSTPATASTTSSAAARARTAPPSTGPTPSGAASGSRAPGPTSRGISQIDAPHASRGFLLATTASGRGAGRRRTGTRRRHDVVGLTDRLPRRDGGCDPSRSAHDGGTPAVTSPENGSSTRSLLHRGLAALPGEHHRGVGGAVCDHVDADALSTVVVGGAAGQVARDDVRCRGRSARPGLSARAPCRPGARLRRNDHGAPRTVDRPPTRGRRSSVVRSPLEDLTTLSGLCVRVTHLHARRSSHSPWA